MDVLSGTPAVSRIEARLRLRIRAHDDDDRVVLSTGSIFLRILAASGLFQSFGISCSGWRLSHLISRTAGRKPGHKRGCQKDCHGCMLSVSFHSFLSPFPICADLLSALFRAGLSAGTKKMPERRTPAACRYLPGKFQFYFSCFVSSAFVWLKILSFGTGSAASAASHRTIIEKNGRKVNRKFGAAKLSPAFSKYAIYTSSQRLKAFP